MPEKKEFIQDNSFTRTLNHPVQGEFLQSEQWRKFQEATGKKTFHLEGGKFWANIIEHQLPIVGKYFYIPRGPLGKGMLDEVVKLAKKEKAGWIRIDENIVGADLASDLKGQARGLSLQNYKIVKAPHDMQPKELFIIDITKTEEELLTEMKPKTRYNIGLAQKRGVSVRVVSNDVQELSSDNAYCLEKFLRLVKITSERQGINLHPAEYYRKMLETIPSENIKLYCAEYEGEIVAANLVIFFGDTVTYLHGASDDKFRNLMAPYLLQWRQIQDAKKSGAAKYDLGGVKVNSQEKNWAGITRFKLGFSPNTQPVEFPGSYDIVISPAKYFLYKIMQKIKRSVLRLYF